VTQLPPLSPSRPSRTPPRGAIDSHAHIFGPLDRFPVAATRSYDVFELPAERYLEVLDGIGFARGVLVTLVDLCLEWTGDEALVRKVLVDNPARLYGWG
jgi:predicted TIM-barrel fold metal-dependent hydrolase